MKTVFLRNALAVATLALLLSACASSATDKPKSASAKAAPSASAYAAIPNERFPIPAVDTSKIDPRFLRQIIDYETVEPPGTIIVDVAARFLYLVRENGRAIRYGVGVGREGFAWSGRARIAWKRAWPTWTPPAEMIARQPELEKYRNGMQPGLDNPLGARALYIFEGNRDTLYRLHGTNEPWSIGKAVSSGCIRLFNQDVIDLYNRVSANAPIIVIPDRGTRVANAVKSL